MYIFQNALKNLVRNLGRNIMIGAIIFAIILTTVITLIINNTASAVIDDYKGRFGSEVYIRPNMEKVRDEAMKNSKDGRVMMRMPQISSELYLQFTNSEYLRESILTGSRGANNSDIHAIDQDDNSEANGNSGLSASSGGMMQAMRLDGGNFQLLGDSWQDFNDGLRSFESGTFPQNDNECVISTELRDANNIKIGDHLTFTAKVDIDTPIDLDTSGLSEGDTVEVNGTEYNVSISAMETVRLDRDVTYELEVVGVYDDLTDEYANENMTKAAFLNKRNEVLTTLPTLLAARKSDETGIRINATYYLKEPDMISDFEAQARAMGLPDTFDVETDAASYDNVVKPVLGLKNISITFMIAVMVMGAIILLLLCSISIRERKYEIGVLRAMGMKKFKVALGLWTEILTITCICLVIGLGLGVTAAQPVSDAILKSQVSAAQASAPQVPGGMMVAGKGGPMTSMGPGGFMSGGASQAQPLSEMKITLGLNTILELILISILLASFAGLVSISKITKYEPIRILMERN
ncbi:putative ABC transport system permease protein [Paenibacillus castaneae]|uniref:ABC transporter permease n=1 Tax=Paenibacillus castaneae TaxID=474957 RepID=UPI000C9C6990|nr:ABC transporter permease [Paenibacillus castaneae]NIK77045.1 putative ABC transport system permease protein [Paenibacillus castaneae]